MDKAYIEWMASNPRATIAYEAFKAGYEAKNKWHGKDEIPLPNVPILVTDGSKYEVGYYDGEWKTDSFPSQIRHLSGWQYIQK